MGFFLGVLLLMWAGIAATFVLPGFREMNQLKSLDLRSRLRRSNDAGISEVHHVHTDPHVEVRTRARDVVAPLPRVRESAPLVTRPASSAVTREVPAGAVFDTWSNQWINLEGDVVTPGSSSPVAMNPRAEAYRRARPEADAPVARRPMAPRPNRPISPARKAALRRRMVLKYMGISMSVTTIPAILTSWTIFVASAVLTWLAFVTWFAIMVRQFVTGELGPSSASVTSMVPSAFDDLPDNIIALRRPATVTAAPVPMDDEFFDPSSVGGFARAKFAVGE